MTDPQAPPPAPRFSRSALLAIAGAAALAAAAVTALLVNIMERKQEGKNPFFRVVELDDQTRHDIKQNISHDERLAPRHVTNMFLIPAPSNNGAPPLSVTRLTLDALKEADAIILGPGSLFESILPNLLIPEIREATKQSRARKIYICNLMTEPGLTTGFSVADHIRQIARYGGFTQFFRRAPAPQAVPEKQG